MLNPFETFKFGKAKAKVETKLLCSSSVKPQQRILPQGLLQQALSDRSPPEVDLTETPCQIASVSVSPASDLTLPKSKTPTAKRKRGNNALPPLESCPGLLEKLGSKPLRLIIVGHNPSEHAWRSGHYYSNPSNWMWRILIATKIAPEHVTGPQGDDCMVEEVGVGFTDVGSGIPGTDSSQFDSATFQSWGSAFYARLAAHMATASASIGCKCGKCGAPALVAFSGKRQWSELVNTGRRGSSKITKLDHGPQSLRPEGWPLPRTSAVWVMTSTSGASPMTTEARMAPWQDLSQALHQMAWPRSMTCPKA